jgi:hypothetical protein
MHTTLEEENCCQGEESSYAATAVVRTPANASVTRAPKNSLMPIEGTNRKVAVQNAPGGQQWRSVLRQRCRMQGMHGTQHQVSATQCPSRAL